MQCGTFWGDWFDFEDSVYFVLKITNPNHIYIRRKSPVEKEFFLISLVTNQL